MNENQYLMSKHDLQGHPDYPPIKLYISHFCKVRVRVVIFLSFKISLITSRIVG